MRREPERLVRTRMLARLKSFVTTLLKVSGLFIMVSSSGPRLFGSCQNGFGASAGTRLPCSSITRSPPSACLLKPASSTSR